MEQKSVTGKSFEISCEIVLELSKTNCTEEERATNSNFRDK